RARGSGRPGLFPWEGRRARAPPAFEMAGRTSRGLAAAARRLACYALRTERDRRKAIFFASQAPPRRLSIDAIIFAGRLPLFEMAMDLLANRRWRAYIRAILIGFAGRTK